MFTLFCIGIYFIGYCIAWPDVYKYIYREDRKTLAQFTKNDRWASIGFASFFTLYWPIIAILFPFRKPFRKLLAIDPVRFTRRWEK